MKLRNTPDDIIIGYSQGLGLPIFAEQNLELTNVVERLGRFYSVHVADGECSNPIARVLNPEVRGTRVHPYDDVWFLPFTRGYRVLVIKHWRSISGPHPARLYYQSYQTNFLYWLATLQIGDVMFYNEQAMIEELKQCILRREFYIAEQSRKDIVAK